MASTRGTAGRVTRPPAHFRNIEVEAATTEKGQKRQRSHNSPELDDDLEAMLDKARELVALKG